MEKENISFAEAKKNGAEKEENIFCGGEENGEGKGGKYLEKENIVLVEERKK